MPSSPRGSVSMSDDKSWRCAECKTPFSKSKLLGTHARQTKHKAYHCRKDATCKKVFHLRTAAIRHESSHSESKNHACSWCKKLFHRRDHCLEHEAMCGVALQPPTSRRDLMATAPLPDSGSGQQINTESLGFESTVFTHNSQRKIGTTVPDWDSQESRHQNALPLSRPFSDHNRLYHPNGPSSDEANAQLKACSSASENTAMVQDPEDTQLAEITRERDLLVEKRDVLNQHLAEAERLIEALQVEKLGMVMKHTEETSLLRAWISALVRRLEANSTQELAKTFSPQGFSGAVQFPENFSAQRDDGIESAIVWL